MRLAASLLVLLALIAAPAVADDAAASKLAAQKGFRAVLEARDHLANRTFTATLVYRYPDRALTTLRAGSGGAAAPEEFVYLERGFRSVRQDGATWATDDAAWLRSVAQALGPALGEVAAIDAPGGRPPDLGALADRLGIEVSLNFRRSADRVAITLMIGHSYDLAGGPAPGFGFRVGGGAEASYGPAGFPERVVLRGPAGRVDAEVLVTSFEPLPSVADDALAPPAGADLGRADAKADPAPDMKERLATDVLRMTLGRLREAAGREPGRLETEGARFRGAIAGVQGALFRAAYAESRLRDEARRAVAAEREVVVKVLREAGVAGRKQALDALRARFDESCRRQLRHTVGEMVRLGEGALAGRKGGDAGDETARRRLVGIAADTAVEAFERAIIAPMAAEAMAEVERIEKQGGTGT